MKPLFILFFGSSKYSIFVLKQLLSKHKDISVVTTPAKPAGRSRKLTKNPVEQLAKKHHLTLTTHDRVPQVIYDLIISADYGLKIPLKILKKAKISALNLHPSLLPKYRGSTPIPTALLNNETQTGVTIIQMTNKIDAGPIFVQQAIQISPQDNAETLLTKCFTIGSKLLIKTLPGIIEHKITPKPQTNQSLANKFPTKKFTKKDGFISWKLFLNALNQNGQKVHNMIRAFHPWPGVYTLMPVSPTGGPNQQPLKILSSTLKENKLIPLKVQLSGKNPITWQQFLAGRPNLI